MTAPIELVLFDIGGVLGSNGWDREQRSAALERFGMTSEEDEFQYRHEETVGALEAGEISLDEYLDVTVFCEGRNFSREEFKAFMFAQSEPWPQSIAVARELAQAGNARLATLNNESEALNVHRIDEFGLRDIFPVFFSSCWLGVRKPTLEIYSRAVSMAQADPRRVVFVDDRKQNLNPAAAMGMHTIQFQSAEQLRVNLQALGLLS
ncbi:MAG TPA: HAD family phosphatase [Gemmatimonadaceae bacterium]|nr:HAD family phosphatase [Gemmatimonadaceae bacterium]